jgi:GNAT superfamily N-acetyltransferase
MPVLAKNGLARHDAPVFRLGRLAIDRTVQGRGLRVALLVRAAIRVADDVGGVAKNDRAARWFLWITHRDRLEYAVSSSRT